MDIKCIAGYAALTKQSDASALLYQETLGLPLERQGNYRFLDKFPGTNHFGVWPLKMAVQSCFGQNEWPSHVPESTATIEFELADAAAVKSAVTEMKAKGQDVDSAKGKTIYSHRMPVVEPMFGNTGANKGLGRFSLRGKRKVQGQWQLYCLVHNIEKLANYGKLAA